MAKHLIEPKGRPRGLKKTEKTIGAALALDDSALVGQAPALEVSIASVTIVHKEVSMA